MRVAARQRGHGAVVGEDDPAPLRVESVVLDEPPQDGVVLEAAPEAGRGDDLVGAVQLGFDPEATLARRARDRLVPLAARRVRRRREPTQVFGSLGARRGVKRREAAFREERPRHVERPPLRLAPPDGDDLGAGGERVPPLGRGGHARADDCDLRGVVVRLVRVDDPRVAFELGGNREPRMSGRHQDMAEDAVRRPSSNPPSTARTRSTRPARKLSSQPVRSRSSSTCRRNSLTVGR